MKSNPFIIKLFIGNGPWLSRARPTSPKSVRRTWTDLIAVTA